MRTRLVSCNLIHWKTLYVLQTTTALCQPTFCQKEQAQSAKRESAIAVVFERFTALAVWLVFVSLSELAAFEQAWIVARLSELVAVE